MCLGHTSHTGRPEPDELVPARYALRVSELILHPKHSERQHFGLSVRTACPAIERHAPRRKFQQTVGSVENHQP
jgi:hypothetical protein